MAAGGSGAEGASSLCGAKAPAGAAGDDPPETIGEGASSEDQGEARAAMRGDEERRWKAELDPRPKAAAGAAAAEGCSAAGAKLQPLPAEELEGLMGFCAVEGTARDALWEEGERGLEKEAPSPAPEPSSAVPPEPGENPTPSAAPDSALPPVGADTAARWWEPEPQHEAWERDPASLSDRLKRTEAKGTPPEPSTSPPSPLPRSVPGGRRAALGRGFKAEYLVLAEPAQRELGVSALALIMHRHLSGWTGKRRSGPRAPHSCRTIGRRTS